MNVVVSGTSSGIGRAIAQRFLEADHEVYGFDLLDASIDHVRYHHVVHDVCNPFDAFTKEMPAPEIIISNAGTQDEERALDVNLMGAMNFVQHFVESPVLRSVLFIASASARNGAEFPHYVASKAGLVGYMKNLALAVAGRGVTCNSISPGGVVTPANAHILESEELYTACKRETLLGKWAQPEEIAELAYYLAAINRSITGEDILVDNGEMLKSNFIW